MAGEGVRLALLARDGRAFFEHVRRNALGGLHAHLRALPVPRAGEPSLLRRDTTSVLQSTTLALLVPGGATARHGPSVPAVTLL